MTAMCDIFLRDGEDFCWLESAATLESATSRVYELAASSPGEYLVLDHTTRTKLSINVDASGKPISHRECIQDKAAANDDLFRSR
jgi:hypothetical protein